jgi:putative glycosyltransferase (TIGR04348 family)
VRDPLNVVIVTPHAEPQPLGNSITAARWAGILRTLGHHVTVMTQSNGDGADLLVALHALRSNSSIETFHEMHPERPIVVALTGTDLYRDLPSDSTSRRSLKLASRIVALQNKAGDELDDESRAKLRVIYQSAMAPAPKPRPLEDFFEVCVLSHLRDVKDPLRAAFAARLLPGNSRIKITHAGRALEPSWARCAQEEERANPRYIWIGEQSHEESLALLARSRALVLSSEMEGGANVIAEAVVCGVPVLCSRIPGNIGMLGPDYPAYFNLKDTDALCGLLNRVESNAKFFLELCEYLARVKDRFSPDREKEAWQSLLQEL